MLSPVQCAFICESSLVSTHLNTPGRALPLQGELNRLFANLRQRVMGLLSLDSRVVRFDVDEAGVITGIDTTLEVGECSGVMELCQRVAAGDDNFDRVDERVGGGTGDELLDGLYRNIVEHASRRDALLKIDPSKPVNTADAKVDLKHLSCRPGSDEEKRYHELVEELKQAALAKRIEAAQEKRPRSNATPNVDRHVGFVNALYGPPDASKIELLLQAVEEAAPVPSQKLFDGWAKELLGKPALNIFDPPREKGKHPRGMI
mmetsp:Transcript_63488/g.174946  ORF Transcript_63488/g.174946 Transcript_63488/m.174946 type:complete len:261 (+) Transcript_63488:275-1057(+)